jgi:ribosomal protein L16 Arg81 hydroxylase
MNDDEWIARVADLLNKSYVSTSWAIHNVTGMSTKNIYDALIHVEEREKNMYSYSKQRDTRDGDVAQAALEALEAGISLEDLLKSNKTVKVWYGQLVADRDRAKAARQREAARQARLVEKQRQEDEIRAAVAEKLTPEELAAFGLNKKGAKK